jgi:hypothetical protein
MDAVVAIGSSEWVLMYVQSTILTIVIYLAGLKPVHGLFDGQIRGLMHIVQCSWRR